MKLENIDRPIAFQRSFVRLTGSICGALLLSQSVYWQLRTDHEDGWWWKTTADLTKETGMSRRELDTARKACSKFLKSERRGAPAKLWYKIDEQALETALSAVQPSLAESANLERRKSPNCDGGKRQTAIRTETTSETTTVSGDAGAEPSQHKLLIDKWVELYPFEHDGREYPFALNAGKDGAAVKRLLASTKMTATELMFVVEVAWQNTHLFNCKQSDSIAGFASRWNEINGELSRLNLLKKETKTPPSGPQEF